MIVNSLFFLIKLILAILWTEDSAGASISIQPDREFLSAQYNVICVTIVILNRIFNNLFSILLYFEHCLMHCFLWYC